jgi:arylsulfatase A-like enzyme
VERASTNKLAALLLLAAIGCSKTAPSPEPGVSKSAQAAPDTRRRVILMVWDGLRPDSITPELTPVLAKLRDQRGVDFRNHHAVYPTFTMMNAAALATGVRSGQHGFYGNFEYQPGPTGENARGAEIDFTQPFFTEDHAVLHALDAFYRKHDRSLLRVPTLFELAHDMGLKTAAVGKSGPAYLFDYRQAGVILDENVALPRSFAQALQAAGLPLPKNTAHEAYPEGAITLAKDNGDPTAPTAATVTLADGVTADPRADQGSPHKQRNAYLMRAFIDYVLPKVDPSLAVLWLRNPDSTEHSYGPGTPNVRDALKHQDRLLGQLLAALDKLGRTANTDLIIASDHGHSSVAADPKRFPLRALDGAPDGHATLGKPQDPGYSASGEVRTAAWMRRAGFPHTYDGMGCIFDPVLGGVDARGHSLHEAHEEPACGDKTRASTGPYLVPHGELPNDAVIIAANGGSEYLYVPSHDHELVKRLTRALQERRNYGALFVRSLYGAIPGTLSLAHIGMERPSSTSPPMPDLIVSYAWDNDAVTAAAPDTPGTELVSPTGFRGMHGSFSPRDVHNTLIAVGPDFRSAYVDDYPSSSLDVAVTIAKLLDLKLPATEGRLLTEAVTPTQVTYDVEPFDERSDVAPLARTCEQDDLECKHPVSGLSYSFTIHGQTLREGSRSYVYFDWAKAERVKSR